MPERDGTHELKLVILLSHNLCVSTQVGYETNADLNHEVVAEPVVGASVVMAESSRRTTCWETGLMITPRQLPAWMSSATFSGHWWPKGSPGLCYPGVLSVDGGVSLLTVTAPPVGQEVFALGTAPTIYGSVDGPHGPQQITLWDRAGNYLAHANNGTDHARNYTHVIVGAHVDDYASARFDHSAVSFNDLGEWSRFREAVPEATPDESLPHHTVATLNAPYRDMFDADYTVTVKLEYPSRVETSERFQSGAMINHQDQDARVVFAVQPPAPALFHELLLQDFQALLTFCYQSGAPVLGEWIGTDPKHLNPVLRRDTFRERVVRHLGESQMIVTPDESSFGELVAKWWTVLDEEFPAPQILTTYLHLRRGLLEQSTASALAATENIHAHIGPSQQRFPRDELAENKSKIKEAFPGANFAKFREFLYEKLRENRPTLGTRLRELVDIIGLPRMEALEIEPEDWTQRFKRVRDKLAHTGAHVHRRGDSSEDLELINAQTRALLTLLLLTRMGLQDEAIDRAALTLSRFPHRSW